jgi:hypothetical protein
MSKSDKFTEIPLTEKTPAEEDSPTKTYKNRWETLVYWVKYWWTWAGAMCC